MADSQMGIANEEGEDAAILQDSAPAGRIVRMIALESDNLSKKTT